MLERNRKILAAVECDRLRDTIRRCLNGSVGVPLVFAPEPSREEQLASIFAVSEPDVQDRFRAAVIDCAIEWRSASASLNLLRDIALLAHSIGAIDIVPILRQLIEAGALRHRDADLVTSTLGWLIATIGSFAPHPRARDALARMLVDRIVHDRHVGQLFLGLCVCDPEAFWQYVPRFAEVARSQRCEFEVAIILRKFLKIVPARSIDAGLDRMRPHDAATFLYLLRSQVGFVRSNDFEDLMDDPAAAYRSRVEQLRDPAAFGDEGRNPLLAMAALFVRTKDSDPA